MRSRYQFFMPRKKAWVRPKPMPNNNLCVYLITFLTPELTAFKVGVTGQDDVEKRLKQLQTGCPWRLKVAAVFYRQDAYAFEDYLHRKLNRYRIRKDGEWFQGPEGVDPVQLVTSIPDMR